MNVTTRTLPRAWARVRIARLVAQLEVIARQRGRDEPRRGRRRLWKPRGEDAAEPPQHEAHRRHQDEPPHGRDALLAESALPPDAGSIGFGAAREVVFVSDRTIRQASLDEGRAYTRELVRKSPWVRLVRGSALSATSWPLIGCGGMDVWKASTAVALSGLALAAVACGSSAPKPPTQPSAAQRLELAVAGVDARIGTARRRRRAARAS